MKVTTKADIFSFGVIVMEFLTKRRPTGLIEEDGLPISLHCLIEKALADGMKGQHQILDPMLVLNISKEHEEVLEEVLKLALFCSHPNPEARPDINEVLSILSKLSKRMVHPNQCYRHTEDYSNEISSNSDALIGEEEAFAK